MQIVSYGDNSQETTYLIFWEKSENINLFAEFVLKIQSEYL